MFNNSTGSKTRTSAPRRRQRVLSAVSALALGAAVVLPSADTASAADQTECTPTAAWTETIPAQGEPQILVDNPEYKSEIPEQSHVEHHPAETATEYQRWSWNPHGQDEQVPPAGSTPATDARWQANTTHYNGEDPVGVAFQRGGGNDGDNGSWFYWTADEVVVKEAWDETVIDQEYVPAQGEPQIWIDNPDYVPAQTIEHPEVTCPGTDPTDPSVDPTDWPTDPGEDQPAKPGQEWTGTQATPDTAPAQENGAAVESWTWIGWAESTQPSTRPVVEVTG